MKQANTKVLTKPSNHVDLESMPFEQRVERVGACIVQRAGQLPRHERHQFKARLWCAWLNKAVLS